MPECDVKITLPRDKNTITHFQRQGMVYQMDAWVDRQMVEAKASGFTRPDVRR